MRDMMVAPNSPAWLAARRGLITASRIKDVCSYLKDGKTPSVKRTGYLWEVVTERLTGRAAEHYVTPAMERGLEMEATARAAYEMAFDVMVDRVGLVLHPTLDYSGASPDALVGEDGLLEIKAPNTDTHLAWKLAGVAPPEHVAQMIWQMVCTERKWCDFMSYDDRLEDPALQSFCYRLDFDAEKADYYASEVVRFEAEANSLIASLKAK